ncbi:Uncharacterised protein [Chlamydia trachomatis]|nr:Uncharacterised protein [Chlamydia trachomatis]
MGKIADLMQKYLDTVSREQLEQDVAEIKALGLVGPSMKEFRDSCLKWEDVRLSQDMLDDISAHQ